MSRALAIVIGLTTGHAALVLLFWALLHVPESTIWMLGVSLAIAVTLVVLAGVIQTSAALAWTPGLSFRGVVRRAPRGVPAFLAALLVCGALWVVLGRIDASLDARRGEIDAWFISSFGWTETAWAHRAIDVALTLVRYLVTISLGLALVAAGARDGWRAVASTRWIRRAFRRAQMGVVGLAFVIFIALPLQAVYWRPEVLPPTGVEFAFVIGKVAIIFVLANVGWALAVWAATRES